MLSQSTVLMPCSRPVPVPRFFCVLFRCPVFTFRWNVARFGVATPFTVSINVRFMCLTCFVSCPSNTSGFSFPCLVQVTTSHVPFFVRCHDCFRAPLPVLVPCQIYMPPTFHRSSPAVFFCCFFFRCHLLEIDTL